MKDKWIMFTFVPNCGMEGEARKDLIKIVKDNGLNKAIIVSGGKRSKHYHLLYKANEIVLNEHDFNVSSGKFNKIEITENQAMYIKQTHIKCVF